MGSQVKRAHLLDVSNRFSDAAARADWSPFPIFECLKRLSRSR